jgi:hypothetical protein
MSFGSKKSANTTPQPTFTQTAPAQQPASPTLANSAEARDRAASQTQSASLLAGSTGGSDEEEMRRRQQAGTLGSTY